MKEILIGEEIVKPVASFNGIRRFTKGQGVERISKDAVEELQVLLTQYTQFLIEDATDLMKLRKAKTVSKEDILKAAE